MVIWILALFVTYLVTTLFGHVVHWSLHQPWTGKFNVAHMTHHQKLYPYTDYYSDTYRHAGKDDTGKTFLLFAIPLLLLPILLCYLGVLSLALTIVVLGEMLLIGLMHDIMHEVFHLNKSIWKRIPLLKRMVFKWNHLHYIHHVNMQANMGIFSFHWDKLFKTYISSIEDR